MSDDLSKFVAATPNNLRVLAPGCFAQISDTRCESVWVEIIEDENDGAFTGVVHSELSSDDSVNVYKNHQRVSFPSKRIQHLGCNRYCFCD